MDFRSYSIVFIILCMINLASSDQSLSVLDFGAVGDGITDDSSAFAKAWTTACGSLTYSIVIVPKGKKFFVKPSSFEGPCKLDRIAFMILGNIIAPNRQNWGSSLPLFSFSGVNGLSLTGNGLIDGQGATWWRQCDCEKPRMILLNNCNNLQIEGLSLTNSPGSFFSIGNVVNATITDIHITAPGDSPNTDGFNIGNVKQINILDSVIKTGDDCIAISTESSNINITRVFCGPGHGISIGSLGMNREMASVEGVYVKNCTFQNTAFGTRIKTYPGGKGYARNVRFEQMILINAGHPIIIDQYYCPRVSCSQTETSAVQISDVTYNGFTGTSADQIAIQLNCSTSVGCTKITVENINIAQDTPKGIAMAACNNAHGSATNTSPLVPCLLKP